MKLYAHIVLFITLFIVSSHAFSQHRIISPAEKALADSAGFDVSVFNDIKKFIDSPITRLVEPMYNESGLERDSIFDKGIKFRVPAAKANEIIDRLGAGFWKNNYLVFKIESNTGNRPDVVAVIKTTDQFDALRIMGTNAYNYNKGPDWVLEFVSDINTRFPFRITAVEIDMVEAIFIIPPTDWLGFATELAEDCPDIVTQGASTVEDLAIEMQKTNKLVLWWD